MHDGTKRTTARRPTRRTFLKGGLALSAGVAFVGPWGWARAQARKPIVIGLTCDATGTFADSGQADRRGMILAIEEQNAHGGVLGRPIEHPWADTETDASVAVRKAQRLIERDRIDFMMGALSSGVAAPLSELAQRYGIVYFNPNSSADTVTNEECQRVNSVWDANNWMFANALGPLVVKSLGTRWFMLTHDYVWGKNATAGTREVMKKVGAEEVGELFVPPAAPGRDRRGPCGRAPAAAHGRADERSREPADGDPARPHAPSGGHRDDRRHRARHGLRPLAGRAHRGPPPGPVIATGRPDEIRDNVEVREAYLGTLRYAAHR